MTRDLSIPSVQVQPGAGRAVATAPTFDQVFHDEAAYVGRTLRYLGVGEAHLEDVCQEVFVVVHRQLPQFRSGSVRGWVRAISVRVASNHRRSLRRRPEDPVAEPPDVAVPASQHCDAEARQARERLIGILDQLSEEQRSVFVLYEIEQLSMPEIAEALGCPLQTAYSRLHAARSRVQAAMKGMDP